MDKWRLKQRKKELSYSWFLPVFVEQIKDGYTFLDFLFHREMRFISPPFEFAQILWLVWQL